MGATIEILSTKKTKLNFHIFLHQKSIGTLFLALFVHSYTFIHWIDIIRPMDWLLCWRKIVSSLDFHFNQRLEAASSLAASVVEFYNQISANTGGQRIIATERFLFRETIIRAWKCVEFQVWWRHCGGWLFCSQVDQVKKQRHNRCILSTMCSGNSVEYKTLFKQWK